MGLKNIHLVFISMAVALCLAGSLLAARELRSETGAEAVAAGE